MTLHTMFIVGLGLACSRDAVSQVKKSAEGKQPALAVSLRAEHDTVKTGAPIILKETLLNRSDHDVTYGKDRYHPSCPVDVLDEGGKFPSGKKLGYHHGRPDPEKAARTLSPEQLAKTGLLRGSLVWITLKPGKAWVETCDVSDFYDMTKPGVYRISLQFHDPETASFVKSNTIEVTVTRTE